MTIKKSLPELMDRKEKLLADIRQTRAEMNARARKEETRRKILVGAVIISRARTSPAVHDWLSKLLDRSNLRPKDRVLVADFLPNSAVEGAAPAAPPPGGGPSSDAGL